MADKKVLLTKKLKNYGKLVIYSFSRQSRMCKRGDNMAISRLLSRRVDVKLLLKSFGKIL